ncbi:MAG: hypothetical protein ACFE9Z_07300 [Promethearchaeota archaeon]
MVILYLAVLVFITIVSYFVFRWKIETWIMLAVLAFLTIVYYFLFFWTFNMEMVPRYILIYSTMFSLGIIIYRMLSTGLRKK